MFWFRQHGVQIVKRPHQRLDSLDRLLPLGLNSVLIHVPGGLSVRVLARLQLAGSRSIVPSTNRAALMYFAGVYHSFSLEATSRSAVVLPPTSWYALQKGGRLFGSE